MQLQKIIRVKLRLHLCLLALSQIATATPVRAQTPSNNPTQVQTQSSSDHKPTQVHTESQGDNKPQSQGNNKPSFLPKILTNVNIQRQPLKASLLYTGMTLAEVEKVMGKPTDTKVFPNSDLHIEILNYRQEPIITKVSLIDGQLSGVTSELKTLTTNNIPNYARGIKIGMSREEVLRLMGKPLSDRRNDVSIYKIEGLAYVKEGQLPVNILLADDRVEGMNIGLETPPKLLGIILPAEPAMPTSGPVYQRIRIGMNPQQVMSIFGQPTFVEASVFKNQKVEDFVYATLNTDASTRFTFIDNVLTRFSFIPQANFYRPK